MNEYNELEDIYFGRIKIDNQAKLTKLKGLYEYVNLLTPPKQSSIHVNYRLLIELTKIFKEDRGERVMKKLQDYGVIKNSEPEIEKLINLAGNFSDEFDEQEKVQVDLDDSAKKGIKDTCRYTWCRKGTRRHSKYNLSDCKNKRRAAKRFL